MKKIFFTSALACVCLFLSFRLSAQGYRIRVKLEGYHYDKLMLAYFVGSKTYAKDTLSARDIDSAGYFVFKGDSVLHPGIYLIAMQPDNNYFQILVPENAEQDFSFTAEYGPEITNTLSVSGSGDNQLFFDLLRFYDEERKKQQALQQDKKNGSLTEKQLKEQLDKLDEEVKDYQQKIVNNFSAGMVAGIINASLDPVVPEVVKALGKDAAFYYYRDHYLDHTDFSKDWIVYSPVLENKLDTYIDKLSVQAPDSIIAGIENFMKKVKAAGNQEVYQYVVVQLLNKYAKSKTVCFDKIYVHLAKSYYCGSVKPFWVEEKQLARICENARSLEPVLCGSTLPDFNYKNTVTKETSSLSAIRSDYTVVLFWGDDKNSKSELIDLQKISDTWKSRGLKVITVYQGTETEANNNLVFLNNHLDLDNVILTAGSKPSFFSRYLRDHGNALPLLFVLDKDKKILYKKISSSQLDEIFKALIK